MAYVISDECVSCGTCAAECPADAISEGAEHFEIDADACLDCGTCADACPTEAIHPAESQKAAAICCSFFIYFYVFFRFRFCPFSVAAAASFRASCCLRIA